MDSELNNINQGDDSNRKLNPNSQEVTNPFFSDFSEPDNMDSRNKGDHDIHGRFNPFGGLPGNGDFTRQLGPIRGGKHVDNIAVDPSVPTSSSIKPPTLGEKRDDDPDADKIGLDPTQGKMKLD